MYVDDSHRDFRHNHAGYWDRDNRYHHFVYYHEHRVYWGYRGPVRVFVSCD